jgi:uncharacterized membrane protein YbhN (UPF0104 family)
MTAASIDDRAPTWRRAERWVALAALGFAAAAFAAGLWFGGTDALANLALVTAPVLAGMLVLSAINYALRALRWHAFGRRLDLDLPLGRSALYYVAGFALTTTPGKLGEALRLWLMARGDGCPYGRTVPILIADRAIDAAAMAALLAVSMALVWDAPWLVAATLAGTALGLGLLARPGVAAGAVGWGYRATGRWPRLFVHVRGAVARTAVLFSPATLSWTMALSVAGWLAECLAFAWLLHAMGAGIGLPASVFVFTAAMLAGALSFLPGGLGGTEAVMLLLLGGFGVPMDIAVPATVVIRVTTLWFAVLLGFAAMAPALRLVRRRAA